MGEGKRNAKARHEREVRLKPELERAGRVFDAFCDDYLDADNDDDLLRLQCLGMHCLRFAARAIMLQMRHDLRQGPDVVVPVAMQAMVEMVPDVLHVEAHTVFPGADDIPTLSVGIEKLLPYDPRRFR